VIGVFDNIRQDLRVCGYNWGAQVLDPIKVSNNVVIGGIVVVIRGVPDNCLTASAPAGNKPIRRRAS
jgi:serine acetyltransferase